MFAEGAATAREHERMLAHLAACAECRKAVFLMHPREEKPAASATPEKGWIWQRLLPVGLSAAALACAVIAVAIYLRPHHGTSEALQQNASVRPPEIQLHEPPVAPATDSDAKKVARAERPKNNLASKPKIPQQENQAAVGSNLLKSKGKQRAANIGGAQATAVVPPVSVPAADQAMEAQSISPRSQPQLPLNGRNFTQLITLRPPDAKTEKKELAASQGTARASAQPETLAGISGHITDRSGAVVAGAAVTLRDASGKTRQTTTSADGSFHLTELPAGQYELMATASGFEAKKQSVELKPSEIAMLQPVLDVGTASETVMVQASAAQQVQTETASVSGQAVSEVTGLGRVVPVPSEVPVVVTVSHGKRLLSLDSAGNLFLSRNRGEKWKKVNPQWAGKAIQIELMPPGSAAIIFQLTTDAGAVWTSKDGTHWRRK